MTTKRPLKLLPVWLAISAVVIIAGIILMAVLGFNTSPDRAKSYLFEVRYDVSVENQPEKVRALEDACSAALSHEELTVSDRQDGYDSTLDMTVITYILPADSSAAALDKALEAVETAAKGEQFRDSEIRVEYHLTENVAGLFYEPIWRGAVALTVGAVVGLLYIGIRFGVGSALTGLAVAAHDALFTLSFLAIARIPIYAYSPLLFAAISAIVSLAFWLVPCMKLRDVKKDPTLRNLGAAEAVSYVWEGTWKKLLILAAAGVAIFAVAGAVAGVAAGARLFLLPCMIPMAVAAYSSVLFGPSLHIPVKAAFDRFATKHKPRYFGKKKAEKPADPET